MIVRSLVQARAAYYILWLTGARRPTDRGDRWVLPKIEQSRPAIPRLGNTPYRRGTGWRRGHRDCPLVSTTQHTARIKLAQVPSNSALDDVEALAQTLP